MTIKIHPIFKVFALVFSINKTRFFFAHTFHFLFLVFLNFFSFFRISQKCTLKCTYGDSCFFSSSHKTSSEMLFHRSVLHFFLISNNHTFNYIARQTANKSSILWREKIGIYIHNYSTTVGTEK